MQVSIERADPRTVGDGDLEAGYRLWRLAQEEARPEYGFLDLRSFAVQLREAPPHARSWWLLARQGAELAGIARVGWDDTPENRHLANVGIVVPPHRRRQGVASALLAQAAAVAEAHARTRLLGGASERIPAAEAFCRALGAEVGLVEHENRLDLERVDRTLIERWLAPRAGYSLLAVDIPTPPELVEEVAALLFVMNDAPSGDLDVEDERWTRETLAAMERTSIAFGQRVWTYLARDDARGRLVGFTTVAWHPAQPNVVWQWGTAVQPSHRGHGLGRWLKAAMLDRILRELPGARWIETTNATANRWMLAINQELGFRPVSRWTHWQVETAKVRYTSRQSARPLE